MRKKDWIFKTTSQMSTMAVANKAIIRSDKKRSHYRRSEGETNDSVSFVQNLPRTSLEKVVN